MNEPMPDEIDDRDRKPSRSQHKRDALAITELGKQLIALQPKQISRLPLDDTLKQQLLAAQSMQRGALARQIQYIGKLLRRTDTAPLYAALTHIHAPHRAETQQLHEAEHWRDQLIAGNTTLFGELMARFPDFDPITVNQWLRRARKEVFEQQAPVASRELFQYLKKLAAAEAHDD